VGGDFTSFEDVVLDSQENGLVSLREEGGTAEVVDGLEGAVDQGTDGKVAVNP